MLNIYADLFGALEPGTKWYINIKNVAIIQLSCFSTYLKYFFVFFLAFFNDTVAAYGDVYLTEFSLHCI